jgi:hypothetical protein
MDERGECGVGGGECGGKVCAGGDEQGKNRTSQVGGVGSAKKQDKSGWAGGVG